MRQTERQLRDTLKTAEAALLEAAAYLPDESEADALCAIALRKIQLTAPTGSEESP